MISAVAVRRAQALCKSSILQRTLFVSSQNLLAARTKALDVAAPKTRDSVAKRSTLSTPSNQKAKPKATTKHSEIPKAKKEPRKKEEEPILLFTSYPKRPLNPWTAFVQKKASDLGPGISPKQRFIVLKERWDALSEFDKQPYKEQFNRECAEWRERRTAWESEQTAEGLNQFRVLRRRRFRKAKAERDASLSESPRPPKPSTPFMAFLSVWRKDPKNYDGAPEGKAKMQYLASNAAARWKELSEADKAPYVAQFEKDTEEYHKIIAQWKASDTMA